MEFAIPPAIGADEWTVILDSADPREPEPADRVVTVADFSVLVLARRPTG